MTTILKLRLLFCLRWASALLAFVLVCAVALAAIVLHLLQPAAGEWAVPARLGPWRGELSGPSLLRVVTNPLVLKRLQDHRWATPLGPITLFAGNAPESWRGVCSPCTLRLDSLGREPVKLGRVEFTWRRDVRMDLLGEFTLARDGPVAPALHGQWQLRNQVQQVELSLKLQRTPIANAFALFADVVPELQRARIEGHLTLALNGSWPSRELKVKPTLDGFSVDGLATAALIDALPVCPAAQGTGGFGAWLPRAVIAAEDQRFFEHTGFDAAELEAAFSSSPRASGQRRGASTLSQQLAKLIYTGDSPTHVRKLRELLYAVELDRTLGKARVMHLYLALAPWGAGQCGAVAAAAHYLGQGAHELDPLDAAWLASLLRNPDAELAQMARSGQANRARVRWIVEHLRPLNRERRRALIDAFDDWTPPPQAFDAANLAAGVRLARSANPLTAAP